MKKSKNTTQKPDKENPEWTREDVLNARPAREVLGALFGTEKADAFLTVSRKRLGRPKKAVKAKPISIRLDPEVERNFRATGPGWHSRINRVLRAWVQEHPQL